MGKIEDLISRVHKDFGETSIMRLGTAKPQQCDVIPSGSLSLDEATGVGGYPRGKIIEVYGPECLVGETNLTVNRAGKGGLMRLDHIEKMQNGGRTGGKVWSQQTTTWVRSLYPDGTIRLGAVAKVWQSGQRTVYTLTTASGKEITASGEHLFMTAAGWARLEDVSVGDRVFVEGSLSPGKAELDQVVRIELAGDRPTYDAQMQAGYPDNFVANGVVVHNSSGKTTLCLHAIAEAQKLGGTAAFIDAEHALDLKYAANLGVDVQKLLLSQPDSGEQALGIAEEIAASGVVDIIVIDSVAALVPQAEIDGEMGASHMGLHARLMSQALRKLTAQCSKSGTTLMFINQLRMKIGVVFGNPEVTTGGNALKFYASIRIDVRKREQLKHGDDPYGNHTHIKIVKNKVAPPFKEVDLNIVWGKGIDRVDDLLTTAVNRGVVLKAGAWYSFKEERIGQGFNNAVKFVTEHIGVQDEIEAAVRAIK